MIFHALLGLLVFRVAAVAMKESHIRADLVLAADHAKLSSKSKVWAKQENFTAMDLFERSRRSYERTYPQYGRIPTQVSSDALTLDFEIETSARVKMTPRILLERGGIDQSMSTASSRRVGLVQDDGEELEDAVWPKVSDWFTAGIDGTGAFMKAGPGGKRVLATRATGTYRQDLSGQIELESVMMVPREVIESNFTKDLQVVLEKLHEAWQMHSDERAWYRLPFDGSKGIRIFGSQDPNKPCNTCHVQWTSGLPLKHVTPLLRMSGERRLQNIIQQADVLCLQRKDGCRPDYHALISLAAWVLRATASCSGCSHTKRCMTPWLVRTHFGDLAMMLKEKYGDKAIKNITADVMAVGHFAPHDKILPQGTVDYLRLPEMAELSGMAIPRNPSLHLPQASERDMPTDIKGLLQLAKRMLSKSEVVDSRLRKRTCRLHSRSNIRATDFTVKDWLDGLQNGKDLMSDHDSPLSQSAYSHMVWKSMGSWRMKPGSDRIYLECRATSGCLADIGMKTGPSGLIQAVGQKMHAFERTMRKTEEVEARDRRAKLHRSSPSFLAEVFPKGQMHRQARIRQQTPPTGKNKKLMRRQAPLRQEKHQRDA